MFCMQVTLLEVLNLAHNRIGQKGAGTGRWRFYCDVIYPPPTVASHIPTVDILNLVCMQLLMYTVNTPYQPILSTLTLVIYSLHPHSPLTPSHPSHPSISPPPLNLPSPLSLPLCFSQNVWLIYSVVALPSPLSICSATHWANMGV